MSGYNTNGSDKSDQVFAHPPQQPSPPPPQGNKSRQSFKKWIFIGVGVVVLVVASVAAAYFINREPTPSEVVHNMLANLTDVHAVSYGLAIEGSSPEFESGETVTVALNGAWSWREGEQRGDHQLEIAATSESLSFLIGQPNVSAELDIRLIEEVVYLRVADLSPPILGSFIGQWVFFPILEQAETVKELTAGEKRFKTEIKKAIAEEQLLIVVNEFPDEEIGGVDTYHYEVAINKDAILSILDEIEHSVRQSNISESDRMEIMRGVEDVRSQLQRDIPNFDIWVGKKDMLPRRVSVDYAEDDFAGTGVLELSNFNNEVSVTKPSESRAFEDILEEALSEALGGGSDFGPVPIQR